MKQSLVFLAIVMLAGCAQQSFVQLTNAHAHNDYEHERPLLEAIENGFTSIEADVHLIEGKLYVVHDAPESTEGLQTLETLYLEPLRQRIRKNKGKVYKNQQGLLYLMIDVKTPATTSYPVLRNVLSAYQDILRVVKEGQEQERPVKAIISGFHGRPFDELLADSVQYAGLDGRPDELDLNIPKVLMPVISQNYNQYLSWKGGGQPNRQEVFKLKQMIDQAHAQGKKVRLWAAPDTPEVWGFLLNLGIDLINTDKLVELRTFLQERSGN